MVLELPIIYGIAFPLQDRNTVRVRVLQGLPYLSLYFHACQVGIRKFLVLHLAQPWISRGWNDQATRGIAWMLCITPCIVPSYSYLACGSRSCGRTYLPVPGQSTPGVRDVRRVLRRVLEGCSNCAYCTVLYSYLDLVTALALGQLRSSRYPDGPDKGCGIRRVWSLEPNGTD